MKEHFVGMHLDFIGFLASFICAIHCAGLPLLLSIMPLAGLSALENPWIEYGIILLSFLIATMALRSGYTKYHKKLLPILIVVAGFLLIIIGHSPIGESSEILLTSIGAIIVSIAHIVNWKQIRKSIIS